jgi:hypothetical protein
VVVLVLDCAKAAGTESTSKAAALKISFVIFMMSSLE